jgi:hypothetical protein
LQAELAPTEIIFIDPDHVGATFGYDNEKRHGRKGRGVCGFLIANYQNLSLINTHKVPNSPVFLRNIFHPLHRGHGHHHQ